MASLKPAPTADEDSNMPSKPAPTVADEDSNMTSTADDFAQLVGSRSNTTTMTTETTTSFAVDVMKSREKTLADAKALNDAKIQFKHDLAAPTADFG